MANVTIGGLTAAGAGDVVGGSKIEVENGGATATIGSTLALLRTTMFAGGSGYTAADPINVGAATSSAAVTAAAASGFIFASSTKLTAPADGQLLATNNAGNAFTRFCLGGITSSFPAIKRNGVMMQARLADDSGDAVMTGAAFAGGFVSTTAKTANYQLLASDGEYFVGDATGGTFTVTLPAATAVPVGRKFYLCSVGTTNAITVAGAGTDTLFAGGAFSNTKSLGAGAYLSFCCDGVSKWYRLN